MDEHSYACNYQTRNNMTEPTVTTLRHHNSYWTREVRLEWFGGSGTYERIAYLSLAKQVLDEMFSTGLGFQLKIHMVWMVDIPSAEEYDVIYPMAFAPMSISPMTLSRSGAAPYSIATLVREVRALARDKVEAAEGLPSGVIFKSLQLIRVLTLPEPALHAMAPAGTPIPLGSSYQKLPKALENKRACLNIKNTDQSCFQYCLVAWKLELHKEPHAERWPGRYAAESAGSGRGRPRKDVVHTFLSAGMDFTMLPSDRPPNHDEIAVFEQANAIGVYIFDWHQVTVAEKRADWVRPIRSPTRAFDAEVQLLLYKGHFCLVTNFQALMGRCGQELQIVNVCTTHTCHRCMQNFATAANLNRHLAMNTCNKQLAKTITSKLRLPELCGKNKDQIPTTHFRGQNKKVVHPLVVYADFETFFKPGDGQNSSKLRVLGSCDEVASFAYHAVGSQGYAVPSEHLLKLYRDDHPAETLVFELLRLASHYLQKIKDPIPMQITASEEESFKTARTCYLCAKAFTDANPKVHDHNHFTGSYRGAACDACNKALKNPTYIPVYFHNLKGFDGHLIVKAIQRLKHKDSAWLQNLSNLYASACEQDSPIIPQRHCNRELVAWMRGAGQEIFASHPGRRIESWGKAIRGISEHATPLSRNSDFKKVCNVGKVIAGILEAAPWESFDLSAGSSSSPSSQEEIICEKLCGMRFEVIAKTRENYTMILLGPLQFMDSTNFLKSSLDGLIKSQRNAGNSLHDSFPRMRAYHPWATDESLHMLLQKIPMPFDVMQSTACFSLPALLPQDAYFTSLLGEPCDELTYGKVQEVVAALRLGSFADYHDVYLYTDVLALADCFEAFRNSFHAEHGLDVAHFISMPSASMKAMLLKTGAKVDLICEENGGWDLMNDVNENIRGGLSCVFQPHAAANNPELGENYDPNEAHSYISYVDVNSLYPTVMCLPLPQSSYKPVVLPDDAEERRQWARDVLSQYSDSDSTGYMMIVTIDVPESMHDFLDFAPVAKRSTCIDELGSLQRERLELFGSSTGARKLMPYLGRQENVGIHAGLLKFYTEVMKVEIITVHRAWSWKQRSWMKSFIEGVAAKRAQTKDKCLKETLKLTMNALYGMMLQNKERYSNVGIYAGFDTFLKAAVRPNAMDWDVFDMGPDGFLGCVNTAKEKGVVLDTPRLVGFSILELSKLHMYRAHYLHFKPAYGPSLRLLMMDTDSFVYHIKTQDLIRDMVETNKMYDRHVTFDLSTREALGLAEHAGKLGCFKYEAGDGAFQCFAGLQSKMYLLQAASGSSEKKAKGIPKRSLQRVDPNMYRQQLENPALHSVQFRRIQSKRHKLQHVQQEKKGLASFNDKVFQRDAYTSLPLGHYAALQNN